MKQLILAAIILGLVSLSFAVPPEAKSQLEVEAAATKDAVLASAVSGATGTNTCSYNFTSGNLNTFLQYCVTVNGNILNVIAPSGHIQIASNTNGEGYGICDVTGGSVQYNDFTFLGTTSNWNPATLVSQTAIAVKIARTSSDGIWTLTQTITQVAASSSIKVVMAIKNNTGVARTINFLRYADVDADGFVFNNFDGTHNTAMGWTSTVNQNGFGFMLQNVGNAPFSISDGFAQNTPAPPNSCSFSTHFNPGVLTNTDGSLVLVYVGTVPASGTKTFNMMYRGL
jgi:hypothetical protein